jgi:signal transduction histidine kinase
MLLHVAHEVRQPLSAARVALEIIRNAPDDAARTRAYAVVHRQFDRLGRLFDDMLEASRLTVGQAFLHREHVELKTLVLEVVEGIEPQAVAKAQSLTTHVPETPVWIDGDPLRLQQVLANLLVNGILYTELGGHVSVDLASAADVAVVTVSDTGRGIRPDVLPHIFEPFTRGDVEPGQGLGVGLAIARQIVELHEGTIRASSRGAGTGSEFIVTLPVRPSSEQAGPSTTTAV